MKFIVSIHNFLTPSRVLFKGSFHNSSWPFVSIYNWQLDTLLIIQIFLNLKRVKNSKFYLFSLTCASNGADYVKAFCIFYTVFIRVDYPFVPIQDKSKYGRNKYNNRYIVYSCNMKQKPMQACNNKS